MTATTETAADATSAAVDSSADNSADSTASTATKPKAQARRGRNHGKNHPKPAEAQARPAAGAQRPARKVHPALERLFELYPKMFGPRFLPLKLGVYQELLALHPDDFKKDELKIALGLHARSTRYLEAVASGAQRHDLHGVAVEPVSAEHVHHAILEVFKRRQSRTPEDLRPKLRARLVEAIEASGLGREAYMLAVRTQDPAADATLDEAFAEVGARIAKREALRRAFEASGRSVAEFAEMYGMDPAEVGRTLGATGPV